MKKTRRTTEQIIRILRESEGLSVDEACRRHGVSDPTYHRWKAKYGQMDVKEAQRLRDLEKENCELKRIVADHLLENKALKLVIEKNSSPERQRRRAAGIVEVLRCSGRTVCRWLGLNRSTYRYKSRPTPEPKALLEKEIVNMSQQHPTLGYRKIAAKLRERGWAVNKKMVQRVRREKGLQLPPKRPRTRRQGLSTGLPTKATHAGHVWAWDFMADYTQRGGKFLVFNLLDEFRRECYVIHADRAIKSEDVLKVLQAAIKRHGAPQFIRSDNGPEFIAKDIQKWLHDNKIKTIYIERGCPWQNGYVESFNSRFREECLNRELLYTLSEARVVFADWRDYYNHERPHRSLG